MNRMIVLGVAAVLALGVAAIALASTGGQGETTKNEPRLAAPSPTPSRGGETQGSAQQPAQERTGSEDKATDGDTRDGDDAGNSDEATRDGIGNPDDKNEVAPSAPSNSRMPLYDDGAGGGTSSSPGGPADKSEYETRDSGNSSSEVPPDYRDSTVSSNDPLPRLPIGPAEPAPMPNDGDRRLEPAPIDGLDIQVMLSFPPQYMLSIQAGLPSGCAEKHSHEWHRSGNSIRVAVMNSMPTGDIACTMIYGMYALNINLGSDFTPGETYTVYVNDQQISFKAH